MSSVVLSALNYIFQRSKSNINYMNSVLYKKIIMSREILDFKFSADSITRIAPNLHTEVFVG